MEPKDARILIIDGGQFFSLAQRLAGHFKEVVFGRLSDPCYPMPGPFFIGDGFDGIRQTRDPLSEIGKVDAVVIPDVGMSALQHILEHDNCVWGSREGDQLEMDRPLLKQFNTDHDLPNPKHWFIDGLPKLKEFLADHGECYVKISKYRGLAETHHFQSIWESEAWFDDLAMHLGPLQYFFPFLVEDPIETEIETGIDAPFVDRWPKKVLHGLEAKDRGCITTVTPFNELPEQVRKIAFALEGWLNARSYTNFASFEARITSEGDGILTDFTARLATPCGEPMLALIQNLPEIILAGAIGSPVPEPEYSQPFAAQALIDCPLPEDQWRVVRIPKAAQPYVYLYSPIQIESELFAFPPLRWGTETIGSVVGLGDTLKQAVQSVKGTAKLLEGLEVKMDGIQSAIQEAGEMEDQGIPFTDQPIPKPELAVVP